MYAAKLDLFIILQLEILLRGKKTSLKSKSAKKPQQYFPAVIIQLSNISSCSNVKYLRQSAECIPTLTLPLVICISELMLNYRYVVFMIQYICILCTNSNS